MTDQAEKISKERILLTAKEVADLTGLAEGTIRHFCCRRKLPFIRISSRCVRFERTSIESWIAAMAVPVDPMEQLSRPRKRFCKST